MRRGQSRPWADEAADGDAEPHAPAETGQVVEPAGVPAVDAAGVGAAEGAGRRGGGDRQVDGEALDIKTGADEAAPFGGAQQLERKQREAPKMRFEGHSDDEEMRILRPCIIESAGEPIYCRT